MITSLFIISCQYENTIVPVAGKPSTRKVWVAKQIVGGVLCDTSVHFTPPDTKRLLNDAGIRVFDVFTEHYAIIALCGAPRYAADHYAFIHYNDIELAKRLGFKMKYLPSNHRRR
ncbi:MAG: hypothetical protein HY960_02795 [Ignavibacteriae bacterium]|nr:hypothetical protein [Ignavibacteriota bacterium]